MSKSSDFPRENGGRGVKQFGHGKSSSPKKVLKYSEGPYRIAICKYRKIKGFPAISV
jgi:hypothetical protein